MGQLFYAWRIWILSRSWVVLGIITVVSNYFCPYCWTTLMLHCRLRWSNLGLVCTQVQRRISSAGSLSVRTSRLLVSSLHLFEYPVGNSTIKNIRDNRCTSLYWTRYLHKTDSTLFVFVQVWLGAAALNDIIIATLMIYHLHRSNTGFAHTSTLLTKFIRLTVETGLVCATFAILDMSFYIAFQTNNYHLAPSIPLSKLYSNSLLVVRNLIPQASHIFLFTH